MNSGNAPETASDAATVNPVHAEHLSRPQALITSRAANTMLDAATYAAFVAVLATTTTPIVTVGGAIAAPIVVAVMRRLL